MHRIDLIAPVVDGQTAIFRWQVAPETTLYRKSSFTLTFPSSVDLSRVPQRLWWDILLICLHPHWLLLRPCQVHLPVKLNAPERQFWLQFLRNGADTLEAYGQRQLPSEPLGIEIVDGDLDIPRTAIAGSGYGTAFSSGKDSLLQAGLLSELTAKPLLVTTTSPLPPLVDHETARRRQVLAAIQARRDLRLVEVSSDYRCICDNGFAGRLGYRPAVSELTDTFLYMSNLLAAGAALGVTRLFLASEAEVQDNTVLDGKIIQHSHFMYSAATQLALARLLAPYGIRFGSLIWPLYSMQVQQLLWARYPDLCDLQYSCWQMGPAEATCSQCKQCFRMAVNALADGHDPQRMGIDLVKMIQYAPSLEPFVDGSRAASPRLPQERGAERRQALVLDAVRRTSLLHVAGVLARGNPWHLVSPDALRTLRTFRRLRKRARQEPRLPPLGVREAYFDLLDPDLRSSLVAIYTEHFGREARSRHLDTFERSLALATRAASSLD
jgi:hypothetical protein